MLIDTHCHLDAEEFAHDRTMLIDESWQNGVQAMVIPAVNHASFLPIQALCHQQVHCFYALGWHPMYIDTAPDNAISELETHLQQTLADSQLAPKLVAIGEIGLDFFATRNHKTNYNPSKQIALFVAQLKLAQHFDLPVILHVRGAIDDIIKYVKRHPVRGGIAHAFNGSMQQAHTFLAMGFKLGFGGAMTYPRALKIRALAEQLPLEGIVLETDAPDIAPAWLGHRSRNTPAQLPRIALELAAIRRIPVSQLIEITGKNSLQVLPKLNHLCTPVKVIH